MEEISYIGGILRYRERDYPFLRAYQQDETWITVEMQNTYGVMFISLEAGYTTINGVLQETLQQMIDTLNAT